MGNGNNHQQQNQDCLSSEEMVIWFKDIFNHYKLSFTQTFLHEKISQNNQNEIRIPKAQAAEIRRRMIILSQNFENFNIEANNLASYYQLLTTDPANYETNLRTFDSKLNMMVKELSKVANGDKDLEKICQITFLETIYIKLKKLKACVKNFIERVYKQVLVYGASMIISYVAVEFILGLEPVIAFFAECSPWILTMSRFLLCAGLAAILGYAVLKLFS